MSHKSLIISRFLGKEYSKIALVGQWKTGTITYVVSGWIMEFWLLRNIGWSKTGLCRDGIYKITGSGVHF
jgi:hypothetical protein